MSYLLTSMEEVRKENEKKQRILELKEAPKTFADLENLAKDSKYAFAGEDGKTTAFLADWTNFYYAYGLLAIFSKVF